MRLRLFAPFVFLVAAQMSAATVSSVTINVPPHGPTFPITTLKVTVRVVSNPVTFRITHSGQSITPATPVSTKSLNAGTATCFDPVTGALDVTGCQLTYGGGGPGFDVLTVVPPSPSTPAADLASRKYTFVLNLGANTDNLCSSSPFGGTDAWTIETLGGSFIEAVCAQSFDQNTPGTQCSTNRRVLPAVDAATVSSPGDANLQGCRVGLDCILVLDHSGSMSDNVGASPPAKIDRLHSAVTTFLTTWKSIRDNESLSTSPPTPQALDDKLGLVYFDNNANWLSDLVVASSANGLGSFGVRQPDILANAGSVGPAGSTSIGGGLLKAANAFTGVSDGNRKVILLMTDGIENTDPRTQVSGTQVQTTMSGTHSPLPNQPPIQIYAVTVGTGAQVNDSINTHVTAASNGFLINTETASPTLDSMFTELIQNFVHYATIETLRLVSASANFGTPFSTVIPVTGSTQSLIFNLKWEPTNSGRLRLLVAPPNGAPPIIRQLSETEPDGFLTLRLLLPIESFSPRGDWSVAVQGTTVEGKTKIPFDLIVLGDDAAVNSDLAPVKPEYRPGDQIVVTATVREFEKPLKTIGSSPNDKLLVQLVRPGASIGDLLAASTASSTSTGGDTLTPVEAKLKNMIDADPSIVKQQADTITLFDDGTHGDAAAGDGTYTASFAADLEGHYTFLFGVEGSTEKVGRFSRQQLRTVNVKPSPDATKTTATTSIVQGSSGQILVITLTPHTATGHSIVGWGPYFWFDANGTIIKAVDNLNGTYTGSIPFTGPNPPSVSVHYIDDPVSIPEGTDPSKLPVPIGPGNVLLPNVGPTPSPSSGAWRYFLDLGPNFPHGSFSNGADGKWSLNAGLERLISSDWSVEGILGYHRFDAPFVSNPHIWQFSVNGKRWFGSGSQWHPFLNAGAGAYRFDPGNTTKFGWNAGGGVLYDVTSAWGVEGVYNYHSIHGGSGYTANFSTVQAGARIRF